VNKDSLIKYGLIGAAIYLAWPYIEKWMGGLGIGGGSTATAAADAAAQAAAAKAVADAAAAKAVATQTAEDAAKASAAKAVADAAKVIADRAAAAALAASSNLFRLYTNEQLAGNAAHRGQADAVAAANARGLKYTHHQWNYFRAQVAGEPQPDPELWAPGATGTAVTVDQYLTARAAAGMSGLGLGLGELGQIHPALMWIT